MKPHDHPLPALYLGGVVRFERLRLGSGTRENFEKRWELSAHRDDLLFTDKISGLCG